MQQRARSVGVKAMPGLLALVVAALLVGCAGDADEVAGTQVGTTATTIGVTTAPTTASTTTTTTTTSTTTTTAPPREPIVIGVAGDTSFTNGLDQQNPFDAVVELLSAPDLMIVNLETAVADPDVGSVAVDKPFLFKSPPAALDLLVAAGIDVVGLANNHTLDFGPEALAQTLVEVDAAGLLRVGAGVDESAAYAPLVVEVGDWQVGVVSLSRVPCDWSASGENTRPEVAWACPPFLGLADAMVTATVADADVTVVMVHGGEEGVLCPSPFMEELTDRWAGLGVDAVVNGHPHVVQGLDVVDGMWVARSSGNFAFPSARGITANSAVFLFEVRESADGEPLLGLRIEPLRADGGVLRPPSPVERSGIVEQIARHSSGVSLGADGVATIDPDVTGVCDA